MGFGIKSRLMRLRTAATETVANTLRPRLIGAPENIAVVFREPHDMPIGDRITLYGLIRGLRPARYLEIGVRWGGSARIVATAMEANGKGKAVGLDPSLKGFRPRQSELFGRFTCIEGFSPEDTPRAVEALGGPPDFVFIDAVHTYAAVKVDLAGVVAHLAPDATILLHDAFHQGIDQAVTEFLEDQTGFHDAGIVSRHPTGGRPVSYSGLRMLRRGGHDFLAELKDAHSRNGLSEPELDPETWNHDPYANRVGNPLGRKDKARGPN